MFLSKVSFVLLVAILGTSWFSKDGFVAAQSNVKSASTGYPSASENPQEEIISAPASESPPEEKFSEPSGYLSAPQRQPNVKYSAPSGYPSAPQSQPNVQYAALSGYPSAHQSQPNIQYAALSGYPSAPQSQPNVQYPAPYYGYPSQPISHYWAPPAYSPAPQQYVYYIPAPQATRNPGRNAPLVRIWDGAHDGAQNIILSLMGQNPLQPRK